MKNLRKPIIVALLSLAMLANETTGTGATSAAGKLWLKNWRAANPVWRGIHLGASSDEQVAQLKTQLPRLAALQGVWLAGS